MIQLIFILMAAGLSWLTLSTVDGWVQSHAIAELIEEKWTISEVGWSALWPAISVGSAGGTVVGLTIGLLISGGVVKALARGKDAALDAAQEDLQKDRETLTDKIIQATKKANEKALATVEKSYVESENNFHLRRKIAILEKRLIGAQQKAVRIKKTQLMTGNTQKPM